MRIGVAGADGNILCQIPALRAGFAELGYQPTPDLNHPDTAFIFVGNPPFDQFQEIAKEKKTIFNVLDCPTHVKEWEELRTKWSEQLKLAHKVTTISKATQFRLKEFCGIDSEVIYYPMKPVRYDPSLSKKILGIKVLLIGRVNDSEKRAGAAIASLIRAGFNESEIGIVGPENPRYGQYFGVVTDEALNVLYNNTDYVMMLSRNEGLGLPALEAACCGAIPIVLPDLLTFDEFWASSPLGEFYKKLKSVDAISNLLIAINNNPEWKEIIKQDMLAYSQLAIRPKLEAKNVAQRIVEIYQTL